jgi:SET domain-containing protein
VDQIEIDNAPLAYIGNSPIAGLGVFAEIPFITGELILDYNPFMDTFYKIKWEDLTEYQTSHNWMIPIDDEYCITSDPVSKIHYINHNRNPNCEWNIKEGIIKAARYIPLNEELTIDYRVEYRPNREKFPDWI